MEFGSAWDDDEDCMVLGCWVSERDDELVVGVYFCSQSELFVEGCLYFLSDDGDDAWLTELVVE